MKRPATLAALLLLVLLPLFLRLWPISHGFPRGYVPDNHVVRCALGMARDRDPVPPVGKYSSYPYLVPYMLLPVYAGQYAVGRVSGAWKGTAEFGQRALVDPALVQLPARVLVAVFGTLTALVLFLAARAAGLVQGAWVAGWLTATSLLGVQFSVQERPWAVTIFFGALALWGALVHARDGRLRPLLLSGACAGLALASHQAGAFFLGLPALAWLASPAPWRGAALGRRIAGGAACVALFALVALLLGHGYYLAHGSVPTQAMVGGELSKGHVSLGGQSLPLGVSMRSLGRLSRTFMGYDPALLLLGLAGLPWMLAARVTRAAGLFLVAIAAFFLTNPSDHVRYLLPVAMLLALPAGMAAERLLAQRWGALALAPLLALPLVQALRMGWVLRQTDTRALAEQELARLPAGALVAIDHYGPLPDLSQAALERLAELRGGELRTREAFRLEALRQGWLPPSMAGIDAIQVEDLFELDPELRYGVRPALRARGDQPAQLLAHLGVTHFLLADRRPAGKLRPPLEAWAREGELLFALNPAGTGPPPPEAFLPTEMDFPLTALWQVERPGPWLELRALPTR